MLLTLRLILAFAVLALLATLMAGCGSENAAQSSAPIIGLEGEAGQFPALPVPSEAQDAVRQTSAQVLTLSGGSYEDGLPHRNVAVSGGYGRFSPDWPPQDAGSLDEAAYAVYHLNVEGHTGSTLVRLVAAQGGLDPRQIYIGLANWDADRWEFRRWATSAVVGPVDIDTAGYVAANGDVMVAVLVLGVQDFDLSLVTLLEYDEIEPNSTVAEAQQLALPGTYGFRGHIGGSDAVDIFAFPAEGSEDFAGWLRFGDGVEMKYTLRYADGTEFDSGTSFEDADYLQILRSSPAPLTPDQSPVLLEIEALSGETDYYLKFGSSPPFLGGLFTNDPVSGPLPFTTTYTWDITPPAGSVFRWNLDADPGIEAVTELPTLQWTHTEAGLFRVRSTLLTPGGYELSAELNVGVGLPYHEVEDNDGSLDANLIDAGLATSGWLGNVGPGTGFDGDSSDYVKLEVPSGFALMVTLTDLVNPDAESPLLLVDGPFQDGAGNDRRKMLFNPIGNMDVQTFAVNNNPGPAVDYKLTWEQGRPPRLVPDPGTVWTGSAPFTLNLTVDPQDEDGDEVVLIQWDFDDDDDWTDAEGPTISRLYETPDVYEVRARAFDEHGFLGYSSYTFTVDP